MLSMTIFKEKTTHFTKHYLGLVDNVFFVIFLMSSLVICYLTYYLVKKIDMYGVDKESKNLYFKKMILVGMTINLMLYFSCLILVSYYTPIIPVEQRFTSVLMILKEINAIMFILNYLFYILTIKNDLYFIQLTLEIRPDLEFFLESDESSKYILYERGACH